MDAGCDREVARENIDNLLTILEDIINTLENPHFSVYSEELSFARSDGILPNEKTLPHIFKGYFCIPLNDFLTQEYDVEILSEFEEECNRFLPLLDLDQLVSAYRHLCSLYEICGC